MVHVRTMFIWHHATTNCGRGCIFVTTSSNIATKRRNMRLKRELAEKFADDREAYTNAKGEYIQTITERALRAGAT